MQAVAIEKRVYQLLEATPKDGPAFAAAVRELLQRETSWVEWKKGGKREYYWGWLALLGGGQGASAR